MRPSANSIASDRNAQHRGSEITGFQSAESTSYKAKRHVGVWILFRKNSPLPQDLGDLTRVLIAQRGRRGMIGADRGPRIAVFDDLTTQLPCRDIHVLAGRHQR